MENECRLEPRFRCFGTIATCKYAEPLEVVVYEKCRYCLPGGCYCDCKAAIEAAKAQYIMDETEALDRKWDRENH